MRSEGWESNMQPLSLTAKEGACDAQLPGMISRRQETNLRISGSRRGGASSGKRILG